MAAGNRSRPAITAEGDRIAGELSLQHHNRLVIGNIELPEYVRLILPAVDCLRNQVGHREYFVLRWENLSDIVALPLPVTAQWVWSRPIKRMRQFDFLRPFLRSAKENCAADCK